MSLYEHFNYFYKALVMEVHVILDGLHFFYDVFGKELRQRCEFLSSCLVEYDDKTACLLQILNFSADNVLVTFDSDNWNTIVAHICDNLSDKLSQLVMSRAFATPWALATPTTLTLRR